MKKMSLLAVIALVAFSQASFAATQDFQAKSCKVLKVTAHSKSSAMDVTYVTAMISCPGEAPFEVHSSTTISGEILVSARSSGMLIDVTYRKFGSSFDGTNGQILSITE